MAVIVDGTAGTNKAAVDPSLAMRASIMPGFIGSSGGRYRCHLHTNLATVISGATTTAGHVGAFRWGSATKTCLVDRVKIGLATVTDFTTLQRIQMGIRKLTGYSASHSGGVATTLVNTIAFLTGDANKLRTGYPTTALTDFRMSDTADLTAGTQTIVENSLLELSVGVPSAGATTDQLKFESTFDAGANGGPIILAQNEGLLLLNNILWGAAGTAVVDMLVEWREVLNAEVPGVTAI